MNAFKIYQDEENIPVRYTKEIKEFNAKGGKRAVLGQLQNNISVDIFHDHPRKREAHTGFTETIKALDINKESRKLNNLKCGYVSPLKNVEKPTTANNAVKASSPIDEDSIDEKENSKKENISPENVTKSIEHVEIQNNFTKLDSLGCKSYYPDIYNYMKKQEERFKPKPHYMKRQPDISYNMRCILVDWLVEVGEEYKLHNETLYKSVAYLDRFLSSMAVARPKLQLLGTCAMFVAAKFEEIFPPGIEEFIYITDDSYTAKQVLRMERLILKVLNFDLSAPTAYTFLLYIAAKAELSSKISFLALYICELTLLEADPYLDFTPSIISSGSIALAQKCLGITDVWSSKLVEVSGYSLSQLAPVMVHLNETHRKSFSLEQVAIRQKYQNAKYQFVSDIPYRQLIIRDSYPLC